MTSKLLITLLTSAALLATGPLHAQAPAAPAPVQAPAEDAVSEVTVTGTRAPTADAPKSATCEYYAEKDPVLRAQLAVAAEMGIPGMGPRIRLPTREPRDPDLKSPPRSAPGSAMPDINTRRGAERLSQGIDASMQPGQMRLLNLGVDASMQSGQIIVPGMTEMDQSGAAAASAESPGVLPQEFTTENAIAACRAQYTPGGEPASLGRTEIARSDETLPLGFALYEDGRFEEALGQFKLAENKLRYVDGGDEAALMVGKIHLLAMREKNNPAEAVVWLKKAAGSAFNSTTMTPVFDPRAPERNTAQGEAAMLLGRIYLRGVGPVAKNLPEARKWFERAFEVGHVAAAKAVGDLYYAGAEGSPDMKQALRWYQRGATLGHAPSQFSLARMYETGEGTGSDIKNALAWYNEAAKVDHGGALYALAYAYDVGEGVPADPEKALGLYKTAAVKGDSAAQATMGSYFYTGGPVPKDLVVARQWFEAAAKGGDPEAMFNLAAMMTRGEGGPVDLVHAWTWLHVAHIQQHPKAAAAQRALEARMTAEQRKEAATLIGA